MAVEAAAPLLYIAPAIVMGLIIGLIELIFVHADEAGMGWFVHGMHALPFTILFVFLAMNVEWTLNLIGLEMAQTWYVLLGVQAVVGIIAMVKIAGAAAIVGKVGEKWYHTLIIGLLIIASPYIWKYGLGPLLDPLLDQYLGSLFGGSTPNPR